MHLTPRNLQMQQKFSQEETVQPNSYYDVEIVNIDKGNRIDYYSRLFWLITQKNTQYNEKVLNNNHIDIQA